MIVDQLALPVTERMRARSTDLESKRIGDRRDGRSERRNILTGLVHIPADVCTDFHNGLMHFCLHFFLDDLLAFHHDALLVTF